jgi:hypothetical protein
VVSSTPGAGGLLGWGTVRVSPAESSTEAHTWKAEQQGPRQPRCTRCRATAGWFAAFYEKLWTDREAGKSWGPESYTSCFLVRASQHRVTPCSSFCVRVHNNSLHTAALLHCTAVHSGNT